MANSHEYASADAQTNTLSSPICFQRRRENPKIPASRIAGTTSLSRAIGELVRCQARKGNARGGILRRRLRMYAPRAVASIGEAIADIWPGQGIHSAEICSAGTGGACQRAACAFKAR